MSQRWSNRDPFVSSSRRARRDGSNAVFANQSVRPVCNGGCKEMINRADSADSRGAHTDSSPKMTPPTSRRTVNNCDARLIDGAIFTAGHWKLTSPCALREDTKDDEEPIRSLVRASWSAASVRQKKPLRHFRSIFRKDQQSQQQQTLMKHDISHKRHSSRLHNASDRRCDMVSPNSVAVGTLSGTSSIPQAHNHFWGLDGVFDEEPGLSRPSLNLDKALPASPGNAGVTSSSHTRTPSFEHSQDTPIRPSTASSVSSSISTKSSKQAFRGLARALVNEDMGARRPDLSPVREAETLPPSKYDPRKSMQSSVYS